MSNDVTNLIEIKDQPDKEKLIIFKIPINDHGIPLYDCMTIKEMFDDVKNTFPHNTVLGIYDMIAIEYWEKQDLANYVKSLESQLEALDLYKWLDK